MTGLTHMHVVHGRGTGDRHVDICDRSITECAVCLSWWEELAEHVRDGRVEIPADTEQTELPL